jgi:hypothetical protein
MNGQAIPIANGLSGPAQLNLTAATYKNSDQWIIIQNTTGLLEISSKDFEITGGQGSVSKFGNIAIYGDTSSGKGQLILHGTMNGTTISFDSPQSQLASTSYLDLSGTFTETPAGTTTMTVNTPNTSENTTSTAGQVIETRSYNSTTTLALAPHNATTTEAADTTSTQGNTTITHALATSNTTAASSFVTGNAASPPNGLTTSSITVTVTQVSNHTIFETQTVANVTLSYTVTATVANTTITKTQATASVNATTTYSTTTGA